MLIRFLPLLLVSLTLACLAGASSQEDSPTPSPTSSASSSLSSAASSAQGLLVATVTEVPRRRGSERLALLQTATVEAEATAAQEPTATSTPTLTATSTPETVVVEAATDTPTPTETPTPLPTETPTPTLTPTETPTETPTTTPSPTASPTPTEKPSVNGSPFQSQLLAGHNAIRDAEGLVPLSLNGTLNQVAQERAEILARIDAKAAMSHYNEDGTTAFTMMDDAGYSYTDGAENIGYNFGFTASASLQYVMQQWTDSPPHHANIAKGNLNYVGFGMATSDDGTVYYSAVFSD